MTTRTLYAAQRDNITEAGLLANSVEELQALIKTKFTYSDNMKPENVIYWEEYRKSLQIVKITTITEAI